MVCCCSLVLVVCFILVLFWGGCVCLVVGFKKKNNKKPKQKPQTYLYYSYPLPVHLYSRVSSFFPLNTCILTIKLSGRLEKY